MVYLCPPIAHIARVGAPLDGYVEALVLEYPNTCLPKGSLPTHGKRGSG